MDFPQGPISIEILELTPTFIKFVVNNVDLSFANALRRIMIAEVPTMAIEFVNVLNNTSSLHDEFLAQRIGLVPLQTNNIEKYIYAMDCTFCKGGTACEHCSIRMTLRVRCELQNQVLDVTSKDIVSDSNDVKPVRFFSITKKDENGNPLENGIVIAKLEKGQEIDIECIARKGIGKDHAKFSPVATAKFRSEPVIDLNQQIMGTLTNDQKVDFVNSCPTKVYTMTPDGEVVVADKMRCMFCEECVKKSESWNLQDPFVKISLRKHKFYFEVETTGVMKPEEIVKQALKEMNSKLGNVKSSCEGVRNPAQIFSNR